MEVGGPVNVWGSIPDATKQWIIIPFPCVNAQMLYSSTGSVQAIHHSGGQRFLAQPIS